MGDRLVGCASYTMSEFHVRNYMARRPHINQEPNVGTSTAAIMYAAPLNVILAVKPLWRISCLKIFNRSLWDFSSASVFCIQSASVFCTDRTLVSSLTNHTFQINLQDEITCLLTRFWVFRFERDAPQCARSDKISLFPSVPASSWIASTCVLGTEIIVWFSHNFRGFSIFLQVPTVQYDT